VSDHSASDLRAQAAWYLMLANSVSDTRTRHILKCSAEEFENEARTRDFADGIGAAATVKD